MNSRHGAGEASTFETTLANSNYNAFEVSLEKCAGAVRGRGSEWPNAG
jgi:hypothetical protein